MNYYERHLGDYAKDTAHLSMLEHGAYNLLLDRYYSTETGIPAAQAHRLARARSKEEKQAVDDVLAEFFTLVGDVWINKRADEEIIKAQSRINAAKENGKRGGRPKKEKHGSDSETQEKPGGLFPGSDSETQPKAHQAPSTNHQTPCKPLTSGNVDSTVDSPGETQPAAVRFAVQVRAWEKARGKAIAMTATDPRVIAWAEAGVTDEQLQFAYELAVDARQTEGDNTPINAGFLDVFVAKVLKPATGSSAVGKLPPAKPWFMSSSAIDEKGAELGVEKISGEQWFQWRDRVYSAAGVTTEMIRKAKIDAGERV